MSESKIRILLAIIITIVFGFFMYFRIVDFLEMSDLYERFQIDVYYQLVQGSRLMIGSVILLYLTILLSVDTIFYLHIRKHYKIRLYFTLALVLLIILSSIVSYYVIKFRMNSDLYNFFFRLMTINVVFDGLAVIAIKSIYIKILK
jgi:hypothetical protein